MDKININNYIDSKIDKRHNRLNFKGFKLDAGHINKTSDNVNRAKIAITPFEIKDNYDTFINTDYTKGNINLDYCVINANEISKIITRLGNSAVRLLFGIMNNIENDTNFVTFNIANFARVINMTTKCAGEGFNDLIKFNIVVRTNQMSTYVVNHNIIFKGDLNKFIKDYKSIYGNASPKYTSDGKLIIK